VDKLCLAGADVNAVDVYKASPLHYVAQLCGFRPDNATSDAVGGSPIDTLLRLLVVGGIVVDGADQENRTPLIWAASSGTCIRQRQSVHFRVSLHSIVSSRYNSIRIFANNGLALLFAVKRANDSV
jgi:ankyrin repeat protein